MLELENTIILNMYTTGHINVHLWSRGTRITRHLASPIESQAHVFTRYSLYSVILGTVLVQLVFVWASYITGVMGVKDRALGRVVLRWQVDI